MLETLTARDGHLVARYNGKFICSSVAPVAEGKKWAQSFAETCRSVDGAIILGFGCGYHIKSLQSVCPRLKIVALEVNKEIIDFNLEVHEEFRKLPWVHVDGVNSVINSALVKSLIENRFIILPFFPSMRLNQAEYQNVREMFLGRNEASLKYILDLKRKWNNVINQKSKIRVLQDKPYSIKNLKQWSGLNQKDRSGAKEISIINILSELVR